MLVKVQEPIKHFKAYYQDNALLIQLMMIKLSEIQGPINCFRVLENCDSAIPSDDLVHGLRQRLTTLIGELADRHSTTKSPLTDLKNYCEHFLQNANNQNKSSIKLSKLIYQIYLSAFNLSHLLHSLLVCFNIRQKALLYVKIKRAIQALTQHFNTSAKQFLNVLKAFKDNENVIFFIMRKKELLIKLYNLDKINTLFKFLNNKDNLDLLLIKRFKSRGFHQLLPAIKQELFFYDSFKHIE